MNDIIRVLCKGQNLFRYDVSWEVPDDWSSSYKSIEYRNLTYGDKNIIGAFFFYLNEQTAKSVQKGAYKNFRSQGKPRYEYTFTTCSLTDDVHLLDLTCCGRPIDVLNMLTNIGIDVFNGNYYRYDRYQVVPFMNIYEDFQKLRATKANDNNICTISNSLHIAKTIDEFFHDCLNYIGQLLTDFENGIDFRKQLTSKGYEGYMFTEMNTSPTICLFSSDKLSKPTHTLYVDKTDFI